MNGIVKKIIYSVGRGPLSPLPSDCIPDVIVVDCPQYAGLSFFAENELRTWVPLQPRCVPADFDASLTRTQYPLTLGWALTPWKAQGMTLDRVVVDIGCKAATPGAAFVALTRVRRPSNLLLEDTFPAMAVIMKQRNNPSFAACCRWERQQAGNFSKTLRRHMRDAELYSAENCWSQQDSDLTELILAVAKTEDIVDTTTLLSQCVARGGTNICLANVERAWGRLQNWPFLVELEEAQQERLRLKSLLTATPLPGAAEPIVAPASLPMAT